MGKNTVEAKAWLDKHYFECAPGRSTISVWYGEFKRGRTSTDDAERCGRPKDAVTPDNIEKINKIVLNDNKVKLQEIVDTVNISKERVSYILHEHLGMRKLCSPWVPHTLTIQQKNERVRISQCCLDIFQRNPNEFLDRYITVNEIWLDHFTLKSTEQQSKQRSSIGERASKRTNTQQSANKIMATIFWDAHGVILIDYIEKGQIRIKKYYASLLDRLNDEIMKKRPRLAEKKVLFHQDNSLAHKTVDAMTKLGELGYELLPHPPYSPDLTPGEFYLLLKFERWLHGKELQSDEEDVESEIDAYFDDFDESYYLVAVKMLEKRWMKCIELKGEYIDDQS